MTDPVASESTHSDPDRATQDGSRVRRLVRRARSASFFLAFSLFAVFWLGLGQRLLIGPLVALLPGRRPRIMDLWMKAAARITLALMRAFADVKVSVRGAIRPESCVLVMNHQSVVDIPVMVSLVPGPFPLIPTRARYSRGIPGISQLVHLCGCPLITQNRQNVHADLIAIAKGAEAAAGGDYSFGIFPEGHRSRNGEIRPFMTRGLTLVLDRVRRPVYCAVVDGLWRIPTFAAALRQLSGSEIRVQILGPFQAPDDAAELPGFIDSLRERMVDALEDLRAAGAVDAAPSA